MSSTETEGRSLVPMVGEARVQIQTGMCKEEGTGIGQAQRTVSSSPLYRRSSCLSVLSYKTVNGPHFPAAPSPVPQHSAARATHPVIAGTDDSQPSR